MRIVQSVALVAISLSLGCSSESPSVATADSDAGASSGSGGSGGSAEVRFRYKADWKDRLGSCPSVSNYRIKFGAIPVPITVSIDTAPDSLGEYVKLEGRTYKDADVLHLYTCGSSDKQNYGRFGTDLALAPSKKFTVTLGGTAATVAEEP